MVCNFVHGFKVSPAKGFCCFVPQADHREEQVLPFCGLLYSRYTGYLYYLYWREPSVLESEHCESHLDLSR